MTTSILTIDPGTRYWGVSVFHGRAIFTCMVKNLSAKDSPRNRLREARKIFIGLCRDHAPDLLVIEKPYYHWGNQSKHLLRIIQELKWLSKKEHIKVIEFSPRTLRKVLCNDENATKRDIVQAIGQYQPELKMHLNLGQRYADKYWRRMVDSISLGICYFEKIRKL